MAQRFEALSLFIDDRRRFLPRFIKRPLRRVPSSALGLVLIALIFGLLLLLVLLASGSDDAPRGANDALRPCGESVLRA